MVRRMSSPPFVAGPAPHCPIPLHHRVVPRPSPHRAALFLRTRRETIQYGAEVIANGLAKKKPCSFLPPAHYGTAVRRPFPASCPARRSSRLVLLSLNRGSDGEGP